MTRQVCAPARDGSAATVTASPMLRTEPASPSPPSGSVPTGAAQTQETVRIPYGAHCHLRHTDALIVAKRGGGERRVPPAKWWINRNTPVGEDAELWERMPHQGIRRIEFRQIIAVERKQ